MTEELAIIEATTAYREPVRTYSNLWVLRLDNLGQARQFTEAVDVTGVVLTKLDGTAKGGIVLAIQAELGIPVKLVGVGEGVEDLVAFDAAEFAAAIFADG